MVSIGHPARRSTVPKGETRLPDVNIPYPVDSRREWTTLCSLWFEYRKLWPPATPRNHQCTTTAYWPRRYGNLCLKQSDNTSLLAIGSFLFFCYQAAGLPITRGTPHHHFAPRHHRCRPRVPGSSRRLPCRLPHIC